MSFSSILVAPQIREKPKVIRVQKKRTIVIECSVRCAAPPEVTWYKEKTVVKKDSRRTVNIQQVQKGEYKVQLEISDASKEDKGSYKFVAKNEKGESSSQSVEITEIPDEEEEKPKPKPKGEAPKFAQGLKSTVRFPYNSSNCFF